jgi:two-component system response regulator RegA
MTLANSSYQQQSASPSMRSKQILIIDEDCIHVRDMVRSLQAAGWMVSRVDPAHIDTAHDVVDAEVVIVDICSDGVPRLDRLRDLRRRFPTARLCAVTSYPSMVLAVLAVKAGADLCLSKPLSPDELGLLLPPSVPYAPVPSVRQLPSLGRIEWEYIARVMSYHQGNISASARTLGVQRSTLHRRLKKYPPRD